MDSSSSHYNPTYDQWTPPYSSHPPQPTLLPPPPPQHLQSPNLFGQRLDYHNQYSHHQVLPVANQQPSYYSHHPPPPQQQPSPVPPQQQHHAPYVPQRIPQQSDWIDYRTVDDASRSRVDPSPARSYQYDYSQRDANRGLDSTSSRSRDEFGYVRKESGDVIRIDGNYQSKSESDRYFRDLYEGKRGYVGERSGSVTTRLLSVSHQGDRNDRRHNEARRRKNEYRHSESIDCGRREKSNELTLTPRKQIQKKSALERLEAPRSRNDWSRQQHGYNSGKRFNGNSSRGNSDRGFVDKRRGRSLADFDVSCNSDVLVAKPVPSPVSGGVHSRLSVTPRSSRARRALVTDDNNEKVSVKRRLSDEASVSEGSKQSTRKATVSVVEKKAGNNSTPSSSNAGGKLKKARFIDGDVQDKKAKSSDTCPEVLNHHNGEAKVGSIVNAAEKISSICEALKEAKDDTNVQHVGNVEACSTEEDVIDGDKSILKSSEDVLDRTGTDGNAVMENEEIVNTETNSNTSPMILPVSLPTATDLSGCSEEGICFTDKSMCKVGSQPCADEDIDASRNFPIMKVHDGIEERKSIGSSVGSLGYGEKDFEKSALDASIYFNSKSPGDQVLAKSDTGGIEDDNNSPGNDSSSSMDIDSPEGLDCCASMDVANVSVELVNANNIVPGDLANTNSFTVETFTTAIVKPADLSVVLEGESKNLSHSENIVNPSVENVSRKEYMGSTPLNSATEKTGNLDSDEGKQSCVNSTSASPTKVAVKGSLNVPPVDRIDVCSRSAKSGLAVAVPSEVCTENVSTESLVPAEDLGLASHHPAEVSSVDEFSGSDRRGLKALVPEPIVSVGKDITGGSSECLVEQDGSQIASTFCDNLPSSSALVVQTNLANGINGTSGTETVTDVESGLHETQPCLTVRKFLPGDRFGSGSSGAVGFVSNLSPNKDLENDPSRASSCLASDSSVSPCHTSPLVAVNEQVQNKTSIQVNYRDSQGGVMHEENSCCAEKIVVDDIQDEKTKPSGGTSKYTTLGTDTIAVRGCSVFPCDSSSSSPRQSLRQIRSEIHVAAEVDKRSKDKQKPKPSGGSSKYKTPGTDIVAASGDSVSPCDSLSSSPRLYRQLRSEIHVPSMVDETNKYKEKTKPSGGTSVSVDSVFPSTSMSRSPSVSVDSVFPSASLSRSPRLSFPQTQSEIHVTDTVGDTSKVKESQKEDILLDTLQEQIMTSHEVIQPGYSLAHSPCLGQTSPDTDVGSYDHPISKYPGGDLVEKPKGELVEKRTDVTSVGGCEEKYSRNSAKTATFGGDALSSDGIASGTGIPIDLGVRLSRAHLHADEKIALAHGKDHVVSVPLRDSQSKSSLSFRYEVETSKKKSNYSTKKGYPRSLPFVPDTKKDANPPTNITKRHTWHRKSETSASPSVATQPLSSTTQQKSSKVTAQSGSSYVRKGNSLLRKPSQGSPSIALGLPPSATQLNRVQEKSTGSACRVEVNNASFLVKTGETPTLERQSKPQSDSSTSGVPNAIATSSGKCVLSYSMDQLSPSLPESIMDSATSGEASHSGVDTFKTSDTLIQTGYASDCQQNRNPPKLDSLSLKRMVYVKSKANQLVAASDIRGASKNQIPHSDGYFKRRKNQLVRNSESGVNQAMSLSDGVLDSRAAANMVSERSSSSAFSDSAVMRPYKQSKFSMVWTQNDPQSRMPTGHMHYQRILPQLVPWKRVTYWRRLMNSGSALRNGSFSSISRKLSMTRKRHTVYTRSTNGYSLRKSKVLSIGGSHLKWSKSIERDSRKANEEATLAVAAIAKKESEKYSGQSNTRTASRNHLTRERVFRFGSLRYKMDPSRRTLQRISDVDSLCSGASENGKGAKRPFIPKRLVIGYEEYVRVGNGNQLVRDPKKRTRVLANEKVRWSLHNVRLRLAKKKKYCQFFTRFGKCNKDDGKCPYVHDPSKIAVCTKFLKGLCANEDCKLTHKVIPERMPDCSYFLQGLCNNEVCPYRHVHVNPSAAICDGFLKGYCSDGDECRKKHSYTCPVFEATGSCSQGSKCKLHHPKNQIKERKRKRPSEPSQKNARGRYFGSLHKELSESEPMVLDRRSTDSEVFGLEGLDFIILGATEFESGDNVDSVTSQSTSSDSEEPFSIENLIRPIALMQ